MSVTLEQPVEVDQSLVVKGGLRDVALPAPSGWERGISVEFYGCGEPILRDKCISGIDVPHRPSGVATFPIFPIEQGATCSTIGGGDQKEHASVRLESTTEWALGRQLATDIVGTGAPSFEDADVLGTIAAADFVHAVSCLEQAAADTGFGTQWYLHGPVRAAAYLKRFKMLDDGLSPTGAPWVLSPGYPVQGATTIRLWATAPVYIGVGEGISNPDTDWQRNSKSAFALRAGLVAFDPCINIAIDVTVPACP